MEVLFLRLFIAISFEERIVSRIWELRELIRANASGGNFTSRDNLHLTLAFIGETDSDRLTLIHEAMSNVSSASFSLQLRGAGRFKQRIGDIWWLGVEKNPALIDMRQKLVDELTARGFRLDSRPYSPHITIGRSVVTAGSHSLIMSQAESFVMEADVRSLSLMKSERKEGGLRYTEIFARSLS